MSSNGNSSQTSKNVEVAEGKVLYNVVRDAFRAAKFTFYPNPNTTITTNNGTNPTGTNNVITTFSIKNDRAVLVWFDTIRDLDYFSILTPWQVVNRLPQANVICRKAPFVRIIQRIQPLFPKLFTFLPKSYILPLNKSEFIQAVARHDKKHIIKPDNGSLGAGITILEKNMSYQPSVYLSIAQEYIESFLVNNTKFDLRVYCLVASIDPLRIYVYRGGVARFCSKPVDNDDDKSVFSQITNTAVNRNNPELAGIESITRMVNDVFKEMHDKYNVDIDALWKRIDKVITLTVLAAYGYFSSGEEKFCPSCGYPRCFQIFGFDVLIDQSLNPHILEVNYRPSLETDTESEKMMKRDMLSAAMQIAAPLNDVQTFITSKFKEETGLPAITNKSGDIHNGGYSISASAWKNLVNEQFIGKIGQQLEINVNNNKAKFVQVYPELLDEELQKQYQQVLDKVKIMPVSFEDRFKMPVDITNFSYYAQAQSSKLPPINQNKPNNTHNSVRSSTNGPLRQSMIMKQSNNKVSKSTTNFNQTSKPNNTKSVNTVKESQSNNNVKINANNDSTNKTNNDTNKQANQTTNPNNAKQTNNAKTNPNNVNNTNNNHATNTNNAKQANNTKTGNGDSNKQASNSKDSTTNHPTSKPANSTNNNANSNKPTNQNQNASKAPTQNATKQSSNNTNNKQNNNAPQTNTNKPQTNSNNNETPNTDTKKEPKDNKPTTQTPSNQTKPNKSVDNKPSTSNAKQGKKQTTNSSNNANAANSSNIMNSVNSSTTQTNNSPNNANTANSLNKSANNSSNANTTNSSNDVKQTLASSEQKQNKALHIDQKEVKQNQQTISNTQRTIKNENQKTQQQPQIPSSQEAKNQSTSSSTTASRRQSRRGDPLSQSVQLQPASSMPTTKNTHETTNNKEVMIKESDSQNETLIQKQNQHLRNSEVAKSTPKMPTTKKNVLTKDAKKLAKPHVNSKSILPK